MKYKKISINTQALCALALLLSTSSFAFDLNFLKNDKEARSHAYNSMDLRSSKRKVGLPTGDTISARAFKLLGESFNELEKKKSLCDMPLLQNFLAKLEAANISTRHDTIVDLLITWRSQDLIDDIFFEVMEQVSYLNEVSLGFSPAKIRKSEIKRSEKLLTSKKIKDEDLAAVFGDLWRNNINNMGCSIDAWMGISKKLGFSALKPSKLRLYHIAGSQKNIITEEAYQQAVIDKQNGEITQEDFDRIAELRNKKILPEDTFALVELFSTAGVQTWGTSLSKYLRIMKDAKNKSRVGPVKEIDLLPNALSSKLKDKKDKITYRQSLYYRFNSMQIGMISDVLKKMFERMDATKTEVVFTFANSSETIPVSPMGQYFLARKLLRKDLLELSRSSFFGGGAITHEDLIAAGLETGLVNVDMLDSALKIDDLWNPEVKQWVKIANYGFRVTGTATLFLPPPYNVISSIALVFIEGLVQRKASNRNTTDTEYDFF